MNYQLANTSAMATRLRELADGLDRLNVDTAPTWMHVGFQILNEAGATASARADTAGVLAGLLDLPDPMYSRYGWLTSGDSADRGLHTVRVYTADVFPAPQHVIDAAYDEAVVEHAKIVAREDPELIEAAHAEALAEEHWHIHAQPEQPAIFRPDTGDELTPERIEDYFRRIDKWQYLERDQRRQLVDLCQIAGWFGDWVAAYANVAGNVAEVAAVEPEQFIAEAIATGNDSALDRTCMSCGAGEFEAHRHECVDAVAPDQAPELAMYDNVYAGWPTNKDRRAGVTRF